MQHTINQQQVDLTTKGTNMNTAVATREPPSVIADMAARFGMDKAAFTATLKATVVPANVSNEQFAAFLLVAKQYNLNPITKEIYAFPAKSGGIQPIVGIDGWCNIINSHPQLDGIEFDDVKDDKGVLTAIACKIFRKDRSHPVIAIEYMSECKRGTEPWKQWPARMLRHKALIQAARYAFGFSGIVDPDEAERMVDITHEKNKAFPNAKEREKYATGVHKAFQEAKTVEELDKVKEINSGIWDTMMESSWNQDCLAVELMIRTYDECKARLAQKEGILPNNIMESFGEGFANTPVEDIDPTFDESEIPPHILRAQEAHKASVGATPHTPVSNIPFRRVETQ